MGPRPNSEGYPRCDTMGTGITAAAGTRIRFRRIDRIMPYWRIFCLYCRGYIADALLECIPKSKRPSPAFKLLFQNRPGAAFACPYCNNLLGFDDSGQPCVPGSGWPVFRYGLAELEIKRQADGDPESTPLCDWALRHRFLRPGTHLPLKGYTYAEQSPPDETVP